MTGIGFIVQTVFMMSIMNGSWQSAPTSAKIARAFKGGFAASVTGLFLVGYNNIDLGKLLAFMLIASALGDRLIDLILNAVMDGLATRLGVHKKNGRTSDRK